MTSRSYQHYLKAIGRKRVDPDRLRTKRQAGDVEIVWDPRVKDYVRHVHDSRNRFSAAFSYKTDATKEYEQRVRALRNWFPAASARRTGIK